MDADQQRSVATAMDVTVRSAALTADGSFDARGTLGVDRSVPIGVVGRSLAQPPAVRVLHAPRSGA